MQATPSHFFLNLGSRYYSNCDINPNPGNLISLFSSKRTVFLSYEASGQQRHLNMLRIETGMIN